ncbi:gamma-type small acid-soluble spore protein [Sporolactobacillus sp. Y61]|jgi:small acid-soluble spore protein E (minor gamma-type SASP)|uniref:Small, acid-soluble spore protein gamma-type n=1 Tax=Sporolactobacillus sp. Y61 TaxID=3160863 RepID=A0AAU8IFZ6_9BACL|nr:gamma-type small acid-soluble spore protein [Sporolactobacillus sp. THM19-2]RYL88911.1 gamma-type small acid-soluble spore protein [Sporolactobacillus sp. THM19-2]
MAKKTNAGTNVEQVKKQNAQSQSGAGQFGSEFASETNAQEVRQQNKKSQQNKQ